MNKFDEEIKRYQDKIKELSFWKTKQNELQRSLGNYSAEVNGFYSQAQREDPSISFVTSYSELYNQVLIDQTSKNGYLFDQESFEKKLIDRNRSKINPLDLFPGRTSLQWEEQYALWKRDISNSDSFRWNKFLTQDICLYTANYMGIKNIPLILTGGTCPVFLHRLLEEAMEINPGIKSIPKENLDSIAESTNSLRAQIKNEEDYLIRSEHEYTLDKISLREGWSHSRQDKMKLKNLELYERNLRMGKNIELLRGWRDMRKSHSNLQSLPAGWIIG